jgi:hypothetical protein
LILPLLRPILVVIGILSFIGTYGDFIVARTLLKTTELYTIMVGLQIYTSGMFSQKWGIFAAGALISALTDHGDLPGPAGSNRGRLNARCGQGINRVVNIA